MDHFSLENNGYNRSEVNDFLSDVIKQTESIIEKCKVQSNEIEQLRLELEEYKNKENSMKDAIAKTEETCDSLRQSAREERETIIEDAKHNASLIVNDALLRAQKVEQSTQLLENNMKIFKSKLKLLIEQQMNIVDEIEVLELED